MFVALQLLLLMLFAASAVGAADASADDTWDHLLYEAWNVSHQGNESFASTQRGQDSAIALGQRALARAEAEEGAQSAAVGKILNSLGDFHYIRGDYDSATATWLDALQINAALDPDTGNLLLHNLLRLGIGYARVGWSDPATPQAEQARTLRARLEDPRTPEDLRWTLELTYLYGNLQEYDHYLDWLYRVATVREEDPAFEPHTVVHALVSAAEWASKQTGGNVGLNRTAQDSAIVLGSEALRLADAYCTPGDTLIAFVAIRLGDYYDRNGDYHAMDSLWRRAVEINLRSLPPENIEYQGSIYRMAGVYRVTGRYAESEELYKQALQLRIATQGPGHPETAGMNMSLGRLYLTVGDYRKAEYHFEQALAIRRKAVESVPSDVAQSLLYLGRVRFDEGRYAAAEDLFDQALAIRREALGPDHALTANCLDDLSRLYMTWGRYAEAEDMLTRALHSKESFRGANHPDVAVGLIDLAACYSATGAFEAAEQALARSQAILEQSGTWEQATLADCLRIRGRLYRTIGRYAEAEAALRRSVQLSKERFGDHHERTVAALNELALTFLAEQHYAAADSLYTDLLADRTALAQWTVPVLADVLDSYARLQSGLHHSDRALGLLDSVYQLRLNLVHDGVSVMSERDALRYARELQAARDRYLTAAFASGLRSAPAARLAYVVLTSKGIVSDVMAQRLLLERTHREPEFARLVDSLRFVQTRLSHLYVDREEFKSSDSRAESIRQLSQVKIALQSRLAHLSHSAAERNATRDFGIDSLLAALPVRTSLLEYVHTGSEDNAAGVPEGRYAAICFDRKHRVTAHDLGPASIIDAAVADYRTHMLQIAEGGGAPDANDLNAYKAIAGRLTRLVWDPVAADLAGSDRVFIAPDGGLDLISFAGLPLRTGGYLCESYTLHYLSSGRDLLRLRQSRRAGNGLLALGDPDFDSVAVGVEPHSQPGAASRLLASADDPMRNVRSSCGYFAGDRIPRLPGTRSEIENIARTWQEHHRGPIQSLLGPEASEDALKRLAPGRRVIHLATHGYYDNGRCHTPASKHALSEGLTETVGENPLLRSGLLLAGANRHANVSSDTLREDGVLTGEEVLGMDLDGVRCVVLSACESGVGQVEAGEGVYGIRRAFQLAGGRTVISSLWPVGDNTTSWLLSTLYRDAGDQDLSHALHSAMMRRLADLRRRGQPDHPFQWAAFISTGDWRGIDGP